MMEGRFVTMGSKLETLPQSLGVGGSRKAEKEKKKTEQPSAPKKKATVATAQEKFPASALGVWCGRRRTGRDATLAGRRFSEEVLRCQSLRLGV